MKYITTIFLVVLFSTAESQELPTVQMQTNFGIIVFELYPERAPLTVANFINYAKEGFYDDTLFHRVIKNFVIQGGGYSTDYKRKPVRSPILNESNNELKNRRGTLSMARLFDDPDSGTSQFFINVVDNHFLDYQSILDEWGYTVFGNVIKGMEVVDAIQNVKTGARGPFKKDTPLEPVIIVKVTVKGDISASSSSTTAFPVEEMAELIASYSVNEKEDSYPADEIGKLTTSYSAADETKEPITSEPVNQTKETKTKEAEETEKEETEKEETEKIEETKEAAASYPVDEMADLFASYGEETETSLEDESDDNEMANETKEDNEEHIASSDDEKAETFANDDDEMADETAEDIDNEEVETFADNGEDSDMADDTEEELTSSDDEEVETLADDADRVYEETEADENWQEDEAGDLATEDEENEENEEKETVALAEELSKPASEVEVATTEKKAALENPAMAESNRFAPPKLVRHFTLPPDKPSLPDKPMPSPY